MLINGVCQISVFTYSFGQSVLKNVKYVDAEASIPKLFQKGDTLVEDFFNELLWPLVGPNPPFTNGLQKCIFVSLVDPIRESSNDGI